MTELFRIVFPGALLAAIICMPLSGAFAQEVPPSPPITVNDIAPAPAPVQSAPQVEPAADGTSSVLTPLIAMETPPSEAPVDKPAIGTIPVVPSSSPALVVYKRMLPITRVTYQYDFNLPGASRAPREEVAQLAASGCQGELCVCVNRVFYPEVAIKPDLALSPDDTREMVVSTINENLDTLAREFRCDEGLSSAKLDFEVSAADEETVTFLFHYILSPLGTKTQAVPHDLTVVYSLRDGSEVSNSAAGSQEPAQQLE